MNALEERRILVTGGSAGIGEAIAELAISRGARVVINGRDPDRVARTASRLGCDGIAGDVSVEDDCRRLVEQASRTLGGLDVLINNAAWGRRMPVSEIDAEVFQDMWRTNVLGCAIMVRECLPHLETRGGDIVNIASTAGLRGYANGTAYCSTKFALRGMTECWQAELRPRDIRVILVNPSEVQTGFGGANPSRAKNPHKLLAEDIAHATISALEMDRRGFVPEVTVYATNPWKRSVIRIALVLLVGATGCAGYLDQLGEDAADCARFRLAFGVGLYAEVECTSAFRPAVGFADVTLAPRYSLEHDPRPDRTPGGLRTAALPALLLGWPYYGVTEYREGYGDTSPYWRGFLAPFVLMGTHHVENRTWGLFYLDRLIGEPRLEEARHERGLNNPGGAQEHGWIAGSATAGLIRIDAGLNPLELLDFVAALAGLDLLGDAPKPHADK